LHPATLELAEARLSELKVARDAQRDSWQAQAERLAIADQRERRPWWRRLGKTGR
jgi:hypothetical protein